QKEGKSPVDYILNNALNSDGSFGTMKNDMDAIWALYIYDHTLGGKVSPETRLGVTIKPLSAAISIGAREQYTSLLQNLSGNIYDITSDAVWTAENPDIANYVEKGLFQALKEGQTVIRAVYSGLSGTAELIVNTTSNGTSGDCVVDIAVVDSNQELIFGPASVMVSKNNMWGLTVLGALDATGLPYTMSDKYEGLVESIAGRKNSGTAGWMYKVNNIMPALSAKDQQIKNGDKIIWWYSTDINSSGPTWDELLKRLGEKLESTEQLIPPDIGEQNKLLPDLLQASNDALNLLETTEQKTKGEKNALDELSGTPKTIAVSGTREPLNIPALSALKEELAGNKIDLSQKVAAERGAVLSDAGAEVALVIPAAALKNDTEITVQKKLFPSAGEEGAAPVPAVPAGYRPVSPLYRLGPEGTLFDKPVTLYIRTLIPPLVRPENLSLAWYNGAEGRWEAVPAVVDAARGLVLARLAHFSDFAVFAKNSKKSFTDVTADNFDWARESVETLAGAGILGGVDGSRFEPERSLSRAEFASLLAKALALKENGEPGKLFSDVSASSWYAGAVAAAAGAGLLQGYGDGIFRPEQKVTREEIAAVLARVKDLKPAGEKLSFRDSARISPWAREAVAAAAARGLVKGFPDGTFRPDAPAARAEAAVMVYRVLAGY
ncbi:MAG: S-layer homology domain-containing protein, partial [Desulfotomaculales bacterium]